MRKYLNSISTSKYFVFNLALYFFFFILVIVGYKIEPSNLAGPGLDMIFAFFILIYVVFAMGNNLKEIVKHKRRYWLRVSIHPLGLLFVFLLIELVSWIADITKS